MSQTGGGERVSPASAARKGLGERMIFLPTGLLTGITAAMDAMDAMSKRRVTHTRLPAS
jgi:hypothetical protein